VDRLRVLALAVVVVVAAAAMMVVYQLGYRLDLP
jgi:hypothetical protein